MMSTSIRKNLIEYIKNNIRVISDSDIDKIYEKVCDRSDPEFGKNKTRRNKIIFIENNLDFAEEKNLIEVKKIMKVSLICDESQEDKMKRVTLELFNKILVEMEKPEIDDLCDFVKIPRKTLIGETYKNIVNENMKYVFENGFIKTEFAPYLKSLKSPHIAFLRDMLKKIGYDMPGKNRTVYTGEKKRTETFYSIKTHNIEN